MLNITHLFFCGEIIVNGVQIIHFALPITLFVWLPLFFFLLDI